MWSSGDTVVFLRKTNESIVVHDFSLMLDRFENRVSRSYLQEGKRCFKKDVIRLSRCY